MWINNQNLNFGVLHPMGVWKPISATSVQAEGHVINGYKLKKCLEEWKESSLGLANKASKNSKEWILSLVSMQKASSTKW